MNNINQLLTLAENVNQLERIKQDGLYLDLHQHNNFNPENLKKVHENGFSILANKNNKDKTLKEGLHFLISSFEKLIDSHIEELKNKIKELQ